MLTVAWDIETDTSGGHGLDPNKGGIVSIAAVASNGTERYFDGPDEAAIIAGFDRAVAALPGGARLVGWNSAVFDTPFVADRARILGVPIGLTLVADDAIVPKYDPLPGHGGGYSGTWHQTTLADVAYELRPYCEARDLRWSLKPFAQHLGIDVVEVDRAAIHLLSRDELRAYNLSDVHATLAIDALVPGLLASAA